MPATAPQPQRVMVPPYPIGGGPVLVASDGADAISEALCRAGRYAASALGGSLAVLGVVDPLPAVAAGSEVVPVSADLDASRMRSLHQELERAVSVAAAGDPSWPIEILLGSPPRVLAREAVHRQASLLVMGIGRHNPLDRLFGAETTLATLRESPVPILAVGPHYPACPQQVVVGLDFSVASLQAAQLALRLLGPGGHLALVHVRPRFEEPSADWQAWDADYSRTLPPLLAQVRAELEIPEGITVETVVVRGDPAPALLAYAQQVGADLVAVGTQRHSFVERLLVGSVATRVLRHARCGVLAVPVRTVDAVDGSGAGSAHGSG